MRLIEIVADSGHLDTLQSIAEQHAVEDFWVSAVADDGRQSVRLLVSDAVRQVVLDAVQSLLGGSDKARILVTPVDTVLPLSIEGVTRQLEATSMTREELYSQIARGARSDSDFILLTILSTIVAAIGLTEDNVAVVVGAMVIAPLLGPNIALAFATSLGDAKLAWLAFKTNVLGLGIAATMAVLIGALLPLAPDSTEILSRTDVGLDGVALALAAGAAAVLSLTTGLSTTLVGVMVAVALLPPTAVFGMLLGSGQYDLAVGAALLLGVNIVCVLLAAKIVFLAKGVRPRTWLQEQQARQSRVVYGLLWMAILTALVAAIVLRQRYLM